MAVNGVFKILRNVSREYVKRTSTVQHSYRLHSTAAALKLDYDLPPITDQHRVIIPDGIFYEHYTLPEIDLKMVLKVNDESPKLKTVSDETDVVALRQEILKKQLRCTDAEVLQLFKKVPRLCDIKVLDELIRNTEILIYLYSSEQVAKLLKKYVFYLTQVDNYTLRQLASSTKTRHGVAEFMKLVDAHVKGDAEDNAKFFFSLLGVEPCQKLPLVLSTRVSNSQLKEKVDYLLAEGVPRSFLLDYSVILMYSLQRLDQEVQYIKRELGELDPTLLRARVIHGSSKCFTRTLSVAAEMLDCDRSDFTDLQRTHLFHICPTDLAESIKYLRSVGFSNSDIRTCVYIIGEAREAIEAARVEVLRGYDIDEGNTQALLTAIYYQIKK